MEAVIANAALSIDGNRQPSRSEKLAACVRHILETDGVPPLNEHATELITCTLDFDASSMELARVILKDVGLTSQLLRVANSALYNRFSRPILSVAHAVTMLGWEAVRNLVSSVRYVEHFAARSPGLRELMLMSVLTALHARDVAAAVGYPYPEDAYLCGLFRNLGEVLVACHAPQDYARIILKMQAENMTERASCLAVLGFSWEDVAERVAGAWNMPERIGRGGYAAASVRKSLLERCLLSVSDYAHGLTHAEYRRNMGVETVNLKTVLDPYGRGAIVPMEDVRRIVKNSLREAQQLFAGFQIPAARLKLDRQAELARMVLYAAPVFDGGRISTLNGALESAAAMLRDPQFELTRVVTTVLDGLREAGFERIVFALVSENHTLLRGRLAVGDDTEEILRRFHFRIERMEGPVYAAMQRRVDVLVDRSRDDRYDNSLLVTTVEPSAFALFPVVVGGKVAGCLYADRRSHTPGLETVSGGLARARDIIAAAISKKAPSRP